MNKVKMQFCVYLSQPYKNDYHINNFFGKPPSKRIFIVNFGQHLQMPSCGGSLRVELTYG
jgi:hypothetical protein